MKKRQQRVFNIGDVVVARGTLAPTMTVDGFHEYKVICKWFDKYHKLHVKGFMPHELVLWIRKN